MTGIDYESEYNNRARVPEHPQIMAGWQRDAAAFRESVTSELDVSYGRTRRTMYDLFRADRDAAAPVTALFIHGGYWQALDGKSFSHMAAGPLAHGLNVAVASYDLCPDVRIGDIADELRQLACTLWWRFSRPIVAYGHSAGGHLTACLLATDWEARGLPRNLVTAGLALSGLFELAPLIGTTVNDKLGLDVEEASAQSPLLAPAPKGTRLTAAVGGDESSEYLRQSRTIVDSWGRNGVETRLDIRPGANHFTVIAPLADANSDLTLEVLRLAGLSK
ncbi:alpha/beta hydrolase [Stappia sp. F7233]|uniref:Alpha/beta hydrolase n=1 Tax=Stappia albiluteola TaxID=2758565 RepID=A0A839A9S6_9HYPH|nr:alpha/beta hydrolase [Stappia albiluteola]MBA5776390.1 alpha/beta hydrolase [Stappia albiluteola]